MLKDQAHSDINDLIICVHGKPCFHHSQCPVALNACAPCPTWGACPYGTYSCVWLSLNGDFGVWANNIHPVSAKKFNNVWLSRIHPETVVTLPPADGYYYLPVIFWPIYPLLIDCLPYHWARCPLTCDLIYPHMKICSQVTFRSHQLSAQRPLRMPLSCSGMMRFTFHTP